MMEDLAAIILNYNTWAESISCANSIIKHYPSATIYIVDNASTKKMTNEFQSFINVENKVNFIQGKENNGYSAGNNIGIKEAISNNHKFIMICNSDICFIDNSLDKMIEFLKINNKCGIVGPQIYDVDDIFQPFYMMCKLDFTGRWKQIISHIPLLNIISKSFVNRFIEYHEITKPIKAFSVSGCCFIMNNNTARLLYPLDENTFLYEEEHIIGSVMEKNNKEVYIIPDTHIIHAHGISTNGMTPFSYMCKVNSEQYYMKQYLKSSKFQMFIIYKLRCFVYYSKSLTNKNYKNYKKEFKNGTKNWRRKWKV